MGTNIGLTIQGVSGGHIPHVDAATVKPMKPDAM
jgi:hypothetical protein